MSASLSLIYRAFTNYGSEQSSDSLEESGSIQVSSKKSNIHVMLDFLQANNPEEVLLLKLSKFGLRVHPVSEVFILFPTTSSFYVG